MYIVKKEIAGKEYYYLRKSVREDGKVVSKTIAYLGKDRKKAEARAKNIERESKNARVLKARKKSMRDDMIKMERRDISQGNINEAEKLSKEESGFASFVQESGLIWGPEPEIYGGLAGFYTYGPLGKLLKNKVESSVKKVFNSYGFRETEGPSVLPDIVWKASGHLETFSDPIIMTKDGAESYRADKLLEDAGVRIGTTNPEELMSMIRKCDIKAPNGKKLGGKIESYSLMMKTKVAGQDASLRPETATVTYMPFQRILNYFRKKMPFGIFQIGKAYRNEISPRQSVLRGREFTQAEAQIFVDPREKNNWPEFEKIKDENLPLWGWKSQKKSEGNKRDFSVENIAVGKAVETGMFKSKAYAWCVWLAYRQFLNFGIPKERLRIRQHSPEEKAFYADDAWDIEVKLKSHGWIEACGVHDRADYDLKQHEKESGKELKAPRENGEKFVPHILEIAFGIDRPVYTLIDLFYDKKEESEGKTSFSIPYSMAPIDVSVLPLMKKPKELIEKAKEVKFILEKEFIVDYDESGSIGKRYLRSMSAGTPFAITIDHQTLEDNTVTIRDRDSGKQERAKISDLSRELFKREMDSQGHRSI